MFTSRPKKKSKAKPVTDTRIGNQEERWVEETLLTSFEASGGSAGAALGTSKNDEPAIPTVHGEKGAKKPRSALTAFGISRKQLELMGIGERELQDRIYRTLTIWSSSMYDSIFTISNQNPDLADKLWLVYSRLVEVCNPRGAVMSAAQRAEFEENMQTAVNNVERTRMQAEDERQQMTEKLRVTVQVAEASRKHVTTTIPTLHAEIAELQRQLERELLLSSQRADEIAKVKEQSNEILASLEETEATLGETNHELHRSKDQLYLAETEMERVSKMYRALCEENERMSTTFKEAASKESRIKGTLEAALAAKDACKKDLALTRLRLQEKGQEAEKLKQRLRSANEIRTSAMHLLKDTVMKYRDSIKCLCDSDKNQLDFVKDNLEHMTTWTLSDADAKALDHSIHSVLNLTHYIEKLPANMKVCDEMHQIDNTPDNSSQSTGGESGDLVALEKTLCEEISLWVKHIDSLATGINRNMLRCFIEHIETIFDSKIASVEKMEHQLESDLLRGTAAESVGAVWIDAFCQEKGTSVYLQRQLQECVDERDKLLVEKELLIDDAMVRNDELQHLRIIANTIQESQQRVESAESQRDIAVERYSHTAELEQRVVNLQEELSHCKAQLHEQVCHNKDQSGVLGRLRVDVDKKNIALSESNATAISLMSVYTALLEESNLQVKETSTGLRCLLDEKRTAPVSDLELSSSLHSKLKNTHTFDNVLLPEEKEVVVQVMQNFASLRPLLHKLLHEAGRNLDSQAEVGVSKHETESIKAWAAKERARFNKIVQEKDEETRDRVFHLNEELTQSNLSVRRLKAKVKEAHREKIEMIQTIMELEKKVAAAPAAPATSMDNTGGGGSSRSSSGMLGLGLGLVVNDDEDLPLSSTSVTSPHLARGVDVGDAIDIKAHSPSIPMPSGHATAPRRGRGSGSSQQAVQQSPQEELFQDMDDEDGEMGGLPFDFLEG